MQARIWNGIDAQESVRSERAAWIGLAVSPGQIVGLDTAPHQGQDPKSAQCKQIQVI